jgi:xanthine/CO dehydrogenase XdhC/CoxF family maturation factor
MNIGAESPEEIALSIVVEIVAKRHSQGENRK